MIAPHYSFAPVFGQSHNQRQASNGVRKSMASTCYDVGPLPEPQPMPLAPDPAELGRALAVSELSPSAFEAHGIYCGLLAASAPTPQQRWLAELLPAAEHEYAETAHCRALLQDLAAATRAQLEGPSQDFDLLLPGDEHSLRERAVAVHEWTRGFLFGLGLAGIDASRLSPQTREAFADLLEITRMDLDDLDDDETNEQALSDVVEFIRVAVLLLHEEGAANTSAEQTSGPLALDVQDPEDRDPEDRDRQHQSAGDRPQ